MKKILSVLLAVCLIVGCLPLAASAAPGTADFGTVAWDGGRTGGSGCGVTVENNNTAATTVKVTGDVEWYPASQSPSRSAGNMVGVTITPPAGIAANDTSTTWSWKSYSNQTWASGKDATGNTLTFYSAFTSGGSTTDTFTIVWNGNADTTQVITVDVSSATLKGEWPTITGLGTVTGGTVAASSKHPDRQPMDVTNEDNHVQPGAEVTLTLTPDTAAGYQSKTALTVTATPTAAVNVTGSGNTFKFTVPENVTALALENPFSGTTPAAYTVTCNVDPANSGTVTADKGTAAEGDTVTVTVTPAEDYELAATNGLTATYNDGTTDQTITLQQDAQDETKYTFTMPAANVTVSATFTAKQAETTYSVNCVTDPANGTGGTVNAAPNADLAAGATVVLTVTPEEGYELAATDGLTAKDASNNPVAITSDNKITMPASNVTVTAKFTKVNYSVAVDPNIPAADGTVSADKSTAQMGDTVTVTVTPAEGKKLKADSLKANGNVIGLIAGEYQFTMPADNVTITAEFEADTGSGTEPGPGGDDPVTPPSPPVVTPDPEPEEPTVTENPDGSQTSTETSAGGTVTATTTWSDGKQAVSVKSPEGETTISVTAANGEKAAELNLPAQPAEAAFEDVQDGWYKDAVEKAAGYGIFTGETKTTFNPEGSMTRGMLATVLYNLSGKPAYGTGENAFNDVAADVFYENPVDWAFKMGVASGTGSGQFSPEDVISREQLVTMLFNYAEKIGAASADRMQLTAFPDANKVSRYAQTPMQWAIAEGLISGRHEGGTNYIAPKGTASRAEVATVLAKFVEYLKK